MKKIFLFILTLILMFSAGVNSVGASSNDITPGTKIENMIENFTDSNSDGLDDNWTLISASNPTLIDGVQKLYATGDSSWVGITRDDIEFDSAHSYYISYNINSSSSDFRTLGRINIDSIDFEINLRDNAEKGVLSSVFSISGTQTNDTFTFFFTSATPFNSSTSFEISEFMLVDLTTVFGIENEPTKEEFESMLKVTYFSGTVSADEIIDFDNITRVNHYMYDVPNIFEDFPSAVTMENIIRVAFFIPLMIIFYLLIPLFNFALSGSPTGSIFLGLLILAFILREVIRFIDPDFHLYGKNSYYDGYNRSKTKE